MKIAVYIADELFVRAQCEANARGCTVGDLVEEGLRRLLGQQDKDAVTTGFRMITYGGGGLSPEYQAKGLMQAIYDSYERPEDPAEQPGAEPSSPTLGRRDRD